MGMTHFDNFKMMTIEQFAEWLDEYGQFDGAPWIKWFNEQYCDNCKPIMCQYKNSEWEFPCSWCELEHKCKFFPDMNDAPNNRNIIKMWLKANITTQN